MCLRLALALVLLTKDNLEFLVLLSAPEYWMTGCAATSSILTLEGRKGGGLRTFHFSQVHVTLYAQPSPRYLK